jgi:chloride channel protein, CIC family
MITQRTPHNALIMSLLSVLVGVVSGIGAVIFRALISLFHNLMFLGKVSLVYEANVHTAPSPWGTFVILVPVLGGLGVAFLVANFAPEAKGHGVPEVMDSIYYNRGIIRPVVALVKSLASALSIGSGGSVGREGPIIQVGATFGSTLGQIISMPAWQRITLIAAGTGGGIAATFNTPIGGMLFAVEIMLHEVSVRTLVPVAISTATATYVGQVFFGVHPAFVIPAFETPYFHLANPLVLLFYVGLGIIIGIASAIYIRSIYLFEDFFDRRVPGTYYTRHMLGMLVVGILMYLLMLTLGHYYIEGVGYAAIQDVLTGTLSQLYPLIILCALKLLATSVTLGSGASGGIFSPALFIGAMLGGAYGTLLGWLAPSLSINPPAFAVAGMAGVVGGATGAAMAAIVMIFEMTLDYNVILPITITVALSNGVRWFLLKETIYTFKLARRGHYVPQALQTNFQYLKPAKSIMTDDVAPFPATTSLDSFSQLIREGRKISHFLVEYESGDIGIVARDAALGALLESEKGKALGDIATKNYVTVTENTPFYEVVTHMRMSHASVALVVSGNDAKLSNNIKGLITKELIATALEDAINLFAE